MRYNSEAVKFQYDFLNDGYDKLPEGLRKAIESGRQIIVFMNPPYGKATPNNNLMDKDKSQSKGITQTIIGDQMKSQKLGLSSSQLYLQFLYRLMRLKTDISFFSTPGFMTQISNEKFRETFFCNYEFIKGFVMNSNEFSDTKSWGLTFSILKYKK